MFCEDDKQSSFNEDGFLSSDYRYAIIEITISIYEIIVYLFIRTQFLEQLTKCTYYM